MTPAGAFGNGNVGTLVRCSSRAVKRGRNRRYQGQTALTSSLSRGSTLPPLARVVTIPAADSVRFPLEWKKAGYGLTHAFWLLLTFFNFRVFQVPEFWRRSGSARSVRFGSRGRGFAATQIPAGCQLQLIAAGRRRRRYFVRSSTTKRMQQPQLIGPADHQRGWRLAEGRHSMM